MIKNLKPFAALCVAAGLAFGLAGCGDKKTETAPAAKADKTLVIGVSPVPGGDMMNFLKPKFAEKRREPQGRGIFRLRAAQYGALR